MPPIPGSVPSADASGMMLCAISGVSDEYGADDIESAAIAGASEAAGATDVEACDGVGCCAGCCGAAWAAAEAGRSSGGHSQDDVPVELL